MTKTVSEHRVQTDHGLYRYAVELTPCGFRALVWRGETLLAAYRYPTQAEAERGARRLIVDGGPLLEVRA